MSKEKTKILKFNRTLPPDEISMFCGQVALILKSGIQLHDGPLGQTAKGILS